VVFRDTLEEFHLAEALEWETWKAEKVTLWQAGAHDNACGRRLPAFMISKRLADSAVPMSLLAGHPNVQFNCFRGGLGSVGIEIH
jgi:glucosamine-6-phosphate deaminase